jgi:hypothetical protein
MHFIHCGPRRLQFGRFGAEWIIDKRVSCLDGGFFVFRLNDGRDECGRRTREACGSLERRFRPRRLDTRRRHARCQCRGGSGQYGCGLLAGHELQ